MKFKHLLVAMFAVAGAALLAPEMLFAQAVTADTFVVEIINVLAPWAKAARVFIVLASMVWAAWTVFTITRGGKHTDGTEWMKVFVLILAAFIFMTPGTFGKLVSPAAEQCVDAFFKNNNAGNACKNLGS